MCGIGRLRGPREWAPLPRRHPSPPPRTHLWHTRHPHAHGPVPSEARTPSGFGMAQDAAGGRGALHSFETGRGFLHRAVAPVPGGSMRALSRVHSYANPEGFFFSPPPPPPPFVLGHCHRYPYAEPFVTCWRPLLASALPKFSAGGYKPWASEGLQTTCPIPVSRGPSPPPAACCAHRRQATGEEEGNRPRLFTRCFLTSHKRRRLLRPVAPSGHRLHFLDTAPGPRFFDVSGFWTE